MAAIYPVEFQVLVDYAKAQASVAGGTTPC